MSALKTGRLPATRPAALKDLAVYALGKLPAPPVSVDPPAGSYPIDCNDRIGDCTYAGVDHLNRGWNALTGEDDRLPTEKQIEAAYFKETGGEDTGCNEADVLKRWHTEGIFGEKIAGYAPVPPKDLLQLHQSVAFYGGCYLGITVGEPQQEMFARGEEWTWVDGQEEDGHCVVALGYGPNGGLKCKTWGGEAILSAGFLAHALDEAWCVLGDQMVKAKGDKLGLDLAALTADLARV